MKITFKDALISTMIVVIAIMLMFGISGCRTADGLVWDTYHAVGLIGDNITTPRRERIERKDIMSEQDRLNKTYQRFIITMPAEK